MTARTYDLILWGASGFTGRLVAEYLWKQYGQDENLKWAVAGRNPEKLKQILQELGCPDIPILTADSDDAPSLLAMAAQTRVVCTTVGPYTRYGSKLVAACIQAGTHYCDLTGEVGWMRTMIDLHQEEALAARVKIVHTCGFDSIPSDMGVFFLQKAAQKQFGNYATRIKNLLKASKGGLSGGTYESMFAQMALAAENPGFAKLMSRTYALNPDPEHKGADGKDLRALAYDAQAKSWIAPFIMAGINTRVVRRSHALSGLPYGEQFQYEEAMMTGNGLMGRLKGFSILMLLGTLLAAKPGTIFGNLLRRFLPKPGEGPDKQERETGFFYFQMFGTLPDGSTIMAKVKGDKDPGYGSTSKMLAECAVCLAKDSAITPEQYGFLTPSTAMGDALLDRLTHNAGLSFEVG
ncbi:MAG: saccharopine dehydrogenase NADP-binding domain-containing protein [Lewinellaceae bacterium]|nr:saccharopine dehydrogenase NADP-binding domain-containing protein [Lewinellaceae bacterium]